MTIIHCIEWLDAVRRLPLCDHALVEKALANCVVALFALGLLVRLVMPRCACAGVVVVGLTTSRPWACPVCFFDLQILRSTMAPPGASRKTASGDVGRRTTRSSAATNGGDGDGQDIATGQQDNVTSDAEQEEQSEVADDDGTVTGSGDDGVTVETAGDTVGAVVATERTVRNDESTPMTADKCLLKHEQDVGSMLSLDNCRELARKRAMEDLFCMFKFPPKDKDSLLLYQIRMMEMLGYTQLATHLWNFSNKIWPELISTITEGLRCRRSTVTEALDKRVVGTLVNECCLLFPVHFMGALN